ncbi:MAG: hypothetical protein EPN82_04760 [Bacteroidetes bacterium]|nr:MAG: hypothetical protein EPN82_04760 [Bacteroidota bacterium]
MSANRLIEQEKIRKSFFLPMGIPESKRIYFINGIFGVGKSRFVKRFLDEAIEKKVVDSILFFDSEDKPKNIFEFLQLLTINFISSDEPANTFVHTECDYNITRYNEILELLKTRDEDLCDKVIRNSSLLSESDYLLDIYRPDNNKIDANLLENLLENKGDRRLITEMYKVSAEAILVDIMNHYFPCENIGDDFERYYSDTEPKKVLIAFDNIEKFDYSLIKWLSDELLDYCCNKKFSDFISYNISYIKENTNISKYIDLRFIISSREDYLKKEEYSNIWNKYESIIDKVELGLLNDNDLQELSDELMVEIKQPDELIKLSKGLPILIVSYIEYFDNMDIEQIKIKILEVILSIIMKGMTENQKDWIVAASFLNEFDEKGLRCFKVIDTDFSKAYDFLKNKNSLTIESENKRNKIMVLPIIREFITEYIKEFQPEYYNECRVIADVYESTGEILDKIAADDLNVIRSFAYFKSFDTETALDDTFKSDIHLAKEFLLNNKDCFIKNRTTSSLKPEIAEKLDKYNKVVDGQKYEMKKKLIRDSWNKLSEELNKKKSEFSSELELIKNESTELESGVKLLRQEYEKDQTEFLETENTLIEMRRETLVFTKKNNISAGLICLGLTVALGLITNFFPDFFKDLNTGNKDLYNVLYISSYTFSILFGILTLVYFIKEINIMTRKDEFMQLKDDIAILEEENNQRQVKMRANKDIRSDSESKLSEILLRKKLLESEIESIKLRLEEPFI